MVERDEHGRVKPGSVLNPNGQRKRTDLSVAAALRRLAAETGTDGLTNADKLARTAWSLAIAGNERWGKLVLEYTDGMPVQRIAGDEESAPIAIRLVEVIKSYAGEPDAAGDEDEGAA